MEVLLQEEEIEKEKKVRPSPFAYRRRLFLAHMVLDGVAISLAWIFAWAVRHFLLTSPLDRPLNPRENYWYALPFLVVGGILILGSVRGYRLLHKAPPLERLQRFLKGWFFNLLYIFSLAFLVKEWDLSRLVVLLSGGFSLLTLASAQYGILAWERYLWKKGKLTVRVLIVGAGEIGLRTLQKLKDDPEQKYEVVGFLDDDPSKEGKWIGKSPVLGKLSDLKKVVESYRVDEVIFAIPHLDPEKILSTLLTLDPHRVPVRVVADLFGVLHQETQVDLIEEIPIYELKGADDSLPYRIGKRVMDLIGGLILFAIFLLTFPIIALAIKLDSPGPIFFVQDRVGEKGRRFKMYKYRTMYVDTPPYAYAPHDPEDRRITPVGRFLRRTSLDELPQVINLLKGDMSLVGPRPEMPFIVEKYNDWQRKRLEVKPGITGLWQILGRKELPLHENLEYDFYYIKNRSLLLDLVILIKTIPALLKRKGAY